MENAPEAALQDVVLCGGISTTARRLQALRKPFKVRGRRGRAGGLDRRSRRRSLPSSEQAPSRLPRPPAFRPLCPLQPPMASRPEANGRGVQVGIKFSKLAMLGPGGVLQQVHNLGSWSTMQTQGSCLIIKAC